MSGAPARGTRRPIGTAALVRFTNNPKWFEGSALYRLDPPIQIFEYATMTETPYVIVANVPASEGYERAVTVFAACGWGTLFGKFGENNDYSAAEVGPRLIGKHDHKRVLNALQGGYEIDASTTKRRGKFNRSRKGKAKNHERGTEQARQIAGSEAT